MVSDGFPKGVVVSPNSFQIGPIRGSNLEKLSVGILCLKKPAPDDVQFLLPYLTPLCLVHNLPELLVLIPLGESSDDRRRP